MGRGDRTHFPTFRRHVPMNSESKTAIQRAEKAMHGMRDAETPEEREEVGLRIAEEAAGCNDAELLKELDRRGVRIRHARVLVAALEDGDADDDTIRVLVEDGDFPYDQFCYEYLETAIKKGNAEVAAMFLRNGLVPQSDFQKAVNKAAVCGAEVLAAVTEFTGFGVPVGPEAIAWLTQKGRCAELDIALGSMGSLDERVLREAAKEALCMIGSSEGGRDKVEAIMATAFEKAEVGKKRKRRA